MFMSVSMSMQLPCARRVHWCNGQTGIRGRSRSVNSIDVVFNFDCIGFTGTPFIDNYPTFGYIRSGREVRCRRAFPVHTHTHMHTATPACERHARPTRARHARGSDQDAIPDMIDRYPPLPTVTYRYLPLPTRTPSPT